MSTHLSFNRELLSETLKLKSLVAVKIMKILLENNFSRETELCKRLGKSKKDLKKIIDKMILNEIIIRWKDKTNVIFLTVHNQFFDIDDTCKQCRYAVKKKIPGVKKKYIKCNLKSDYECIHSKTLVNRNCFDAIKRSCTRISMREFYVKKINESEYKPTVQWKPNDFVKFFEREFKKYCPFLICPNKIALRKKLAISLDIFRQKVKDRWRVVLRRYIQESIKHYKESDVPIPFSFLDDSVQIVRFLKNIGKKVQKTEFCSEKEINCSYCVGQTCSLKKNGIECTDTTINKMKELYN